MIDKPHQIHLMLGAAKDYQDGLMSLHTLIEKIWGLVNIIEDDTLSDQLSNALCDLEQVDAHIAMAGYDFEASGKPIVDRAVAEIVAKVELHSPRSD